MPRRHEPGTPPQGGGVEDRRPAGPSPPAGPLARATSEAFAAGLDDGLFGLPPTRADGYACRGAYCHGYAYGRAARGPETAWTWAALNPN